MKQSGIESALEVRMKTIKASKKFDLILGRFLDLLGNRFKSEFRYLPFVADHADWKLIQSLLFRNQPLTLNGSNYFPIYVDGDLFGAIKHEGESLHSLDQNKILELVDMILGETLSSLYKSESMQRLEDNLYSSSAPSGVVKLADFKKAKAPERGSLYSAKSMMSAEFQSASHQRLLNIATLIEAPEIEDAFKMALEVHEEGKRFAFINYWDLPKAVREDAQALRELGAMTIYLPNIQLLSAGEQSALKQQFKALTEEKVPMEERPLWLSATTVAYVDLMKLRDLDQQLLKYLSMSFLRIQKSIENMLGPGPQSDLH